MTSMPGVELESRAALDAWLGSGRSLTGAYVQSVDLRGLAPAMLAAGVYQEE